MVVLGGGGELPLYSAAGTRVLLIGGDRLGERHMFWNFVHSDPARIEAAKADWRALGCPLSLYDRAKTQAELC